MYTGCSLFSPMTKATRTAATGLPYGKCPARRRSSPRATRMTLCRDWHLESPGKYLISVLADGYKMGGAHFDHASGRSVNSGDCSPIRCQPPPCASGSLRISRPSTGRWMPPASLAWQGFFAIVKDPGGDVSTDVFGNPLCTEYDANGNPSQAPAPPPV